MENNLEIYNKVRTVPGEAQKKIEAGRLRGKTDINPMWRIKTLTDNFGPCGIGWKLEDESYWIEQGATEERAAFCRVKLRIKHNSEWSDPIIGVGGSSFVAMEKNGLYTSDECFKMALTDAISVCCKHLGFGADVYWEKDANKYDPKPNDTMPNDKKPKAKEQTSREKIESYIKNDYIPEEMVLDYIKKYYQLDSIASLSEVQANSVCKSIEKSIEKEMSKAMSDDNT